MASWALQVAVQLLQVAINCSHGNATQFLYRGPLVLCKLFAPPDPLRFWSYPYAFLLDFLIGVENHIDEKSRSVYWDLIMFIMLDAKLSVDGTNVMLSEIGALPQFWVP